MHPILVVPTVLALASMVTAESHVPECNSLEPATLDFQWLIRSSPLKIYRSISPFDNCGQVVFVGPGGDSTTSYTGTSIAILGNFTFTYDFNLINNSLLRSVFCSNGIRKDFQTVYVNSDYPSASLCIVSCNAKDGTKFDILACAGRTSKDERDIETFLNCDLKGVKGIMNTQTGCPKPQYCHTFTN